MSEEIEFGKDSLGRDMPSPTDSAVADFNAWVKTATMGDARAVVNYLLLKYNQLDEVRKGYVARLSMIGASTAEYQKIVSELKDKVYPMLQRIEDRVCTCRRRVIELESKPLDS